MDSSGYGGRGHRQLTSKEKEATQVRSLVVSFFVSVLENSECYLLDI